jgi:hypothetical protein
MMAIVLSFRCVDRAVFVIYAIGGPVKRLVSHDRYAAASPLLLVGSLRDGMIDCSRDGMIDCSKEDRNDEA